MRIKIVPIGNPAYLLQPWGLVTSCSYRYRLARPVVITSQLANLIRIEIAYYYCCNYYFHK